MARTPAPLTPPSAHRIGERAGRAVLLSTGRLDVCLTPDEAVRLARELLTEATGVEPRGCTTDWLLRMAGRVCDLSEILQATSNRKGV